ncbi:hypothetical protein CTI12_AA209760 [Artemisia annua]|uniref:RRM domain-containing protein n=1 Tax=Artemisia annua TaxID=35608 RepID=A0A2U1NZZ9_ARTAN|nr:hypothetical protein CTI12_AA209760 [Artemisia annua]
MADRKWQSFNSKEDQYVMGSYKSMEDDVMKISTSIFVTNFPEQTSAKDLWMACKQYGQVVDAFIPIRRSKIGKRFGFVRFIKIFDVERLVNNLCTVWIGSHRLHANVARFQRASRQNSNNYGSVKGESRKSNVDVKPVSGDLGVNKSFARVVKGGIQGCNVPEDKPVMVLDEDCVNKEEYKWGLHGKVKEFGLLHNLKTALGKEGFGDVGLSYLGGLWVMLDFKSLEAKVNFESKAGVCSWFSQIIQASNDFVVDERIAWVEVEGVPLKVWTDNTFRKISTKWGLLMDVDNSEEGGLFSKRLCLCVKGMEPIFESFKIMFKGKSFVIRAKEMSGWSPDFEDHDDEESELEEGQFDGEFKGEEVNSDVDLEEEDEVNEVPETVYEDETSNHNGAADTQGVTDKKSADPFDLYTLLRKNTGEKKKDDSSSESLKFPPGFTPMENKDEHVQEVDPEQGNNDEQDNIVGDENQVHKEKGSDRLI